MGSSVVAVPTCASEGFAAPAEWYVVQAKRRQERLAGACLRQRGVESYLPLMRRWPATVATLPPSPMFPGYLFVHATLPPQLDTVRWTPGVKAFVASGGRPGAIADSVIAFLRAREDETGVIRCGRPFAPDSEVRIVAGPLRGLVGIVAVSSSERERVSVLIDILRQGTRVDLPAHWIRTV